MKKCIDRTFYYYSDNAYEIIVIIVFLIININKNIINE